MLRLWRGTAGPDVGPLPAGHEDGSLPRLWADGVRAGGGLGHALDLATACPADTVLEQGALPRAADCGDCGRSLQTGDEALHDTALTEVLCLECVSLDTVHCLGTPGAGARREHERRLGRNHTQVRTRHPRLGGVIIALSEDPQHVRAWQIGAVGEEEFGRRLSGCAGPQLKVLRDRKVPRSAANIDHLTVTPEAVWIIDAKRYRGRVETRGGLGWLGRSDPQAAGAGGDRSVAGRRRREAARTRPPGRLTTCGDSWMIGSATVPPPTGID